MSQPEEEKLVKTTIRLPESDLLRLKAIYPRAGYSRILRKLIKNHLEKHDEKVHRELTEISVEEPNFE